MNTTQAKTGVEVERLIEEALEKATPGDWHWNEDDNMYPSPYDYKRKLYPEAIIQTDSGFYGPRTGDREYIVAVQPANIRQLLASLAAKRAEAVRVREENEKLMDILRSWKAAQDYTAQYSHLPDARDDISGAWESAMQARDAALSPSQQGEPK